MIRRVPFYILLLCLFCSCDQVFEYHPYELKLSHKYKNINEKNIARIEAAGADKDTIYLAFMGDSQRWYDETEDFVKHINRRGDIDFVIHGGDITDFGMKKEYCWIHDIMERLTVPYVALLGNHDNLGSGTEVYEVMYGNPNFSFVFGKTKFVCLNTNALDFDYGVAVPDFEFLQREIDDGKTNDAYTQTIVAMHVPPGDVMFNNNVKQPFQEYLNRLKNLRYCLHAHNHRVIIEEYFNDGIVYYGCAAMKQRNYFLFKITQNGYTYELVDF